MKDRSRRFMTGMMTLECREKKEICAETKIKKVGMEEIKEWREKKKQD